MEWKKKKSSEYGMLRRGGIRTRGGDPGQQFEGSLPLESGDGECTKSLSLPTINPHIFLRLGAFMYIMCFVKHFIHLP